MQVSRPITTALKVEEIKATHEAIGSPHSSDIREPRSPMGGELSQELRSLKQDNSGSSAIITFGRQSRQIFLEAHNAIQRLVQKIKEIWNIPRKLYWLLVNGKHESLVTSWPRVSTIQIKIKGLAGYDRLADGNDDDQLDVGPPVPSGEKFKKGWIKLGIAGLALKVHTSLTIDQVADKDGFSAGFEYWFPNGRRVDRDEKLRYMFPPVLEEVYLIDELVEGDTRENLKEIGPVVLKMEDSVITVLNNQTLEEAFKKSGIQLKTDFIILPNDVRVDAREDRIRQHLECNVEDEIEI
jgi:hypothetical protein